MNKEHAQQVLLDSLDDMQRRTAAYARRLAIADWELEDVQSWTVLKCIEGDYRRIRKYQGMGPIAAFLARTVRNLVHDYATSRRRKWRPTKAVEALGADAIELEQLTTRDRMSWHEAAQHLKQRSNGRLSEQQVDRLLELLPVRRHVIFREHDPTREVDLASYEAQRRLVRALHSALSELEHSELRVLDSYFSRRPLAQVANDEGIPARQAYGLRERALRRLRTSLRRQGLCVEDLSIAARTPWQCSLGASSDAGAAQQL